MALTVYATLVDDATGSWNPDPPADHEGWNNTSGDKAWVPDETYYRRVLLELKDSLGGDPEKFQYANIVNWEIYGGTDGMEFVANASTVTVTATVGGDYTEATAPAFLNDQTTRTVWVRNSTPGNDTPTPGAYYDNTGTPWVSSLRANGGRVVVNLPVYFKWDTAGTQTTEFLIEAFLPGSFGTPTDSTTLAISNPDIALLGGETGAVQPRAEEVEAAVEPVPDPMEATTVKPKKSRKKKADDEPLG